MRDVERVFDDYLVLAGQAGDRRAMTALFRRWNKKLVAHGWRLTGDTDLAREAAQDAWIDIVRGITALQDARAFPAWTYRIMTRRCAKQIQAIQARRKLTAEAAKEAQVLSPNEGLDTDAAKLRTAISRLAPEQRATVALFYFDEMSVAEVAVALDVPAGTVKTRLMHARHKLREILKGEPTCVTSNG
jgi:RNA polymerase sigma factor (sigma-70 family)